MCSLLHRCNHFRMDCPRKSRKGIKYWYSSQKNLFRTLRRIHSVCKLSPLIYGTQTASCYLLNNKNIRNFSTDLLNSPCTRWTSLCQQWHCLLVKTVSIKSRGKSNDALIIGLISQDPFIAWTEDYLDFIAY